MQEILPQLIELLEISPGKAAHVVIRSREIDGKTAAWDDDGDGIEPDGGPETILQDLPGDATREELRAFLQSLNEDEQASLVALAWIGRGTYAPGELGEAISAAKAEHGLDATQYLFSLPLLPDYLEDAMDQLGISIEDAEAGILGHAGPK
jgi:Protein of unknown function (DUF3775)